MILFKFPFGRPDSETMRKIAQEADVNWDETSIKIYDSSIGYAKGQESDVESIKDAAESLIGVMPEYHDPEDQT